MKAIHVMTLFSLLIAGNAQAFIPEASGVTKVGSTVIIGGDEDSGVLWLSEGNKTPQKIKVPAKWDDLEGLATLDEKRFFLITSHSLTKKGKRRAEREQLFLMNLDSEISVEKTFSLRDLILSGLEEKLAGEIDVKLLRKGTPDEGGLNIEGLAYTSGKLYLGLRSPLTKKGEAIIIEMDQAQTNPQISRVLRVGLGGEGIRSLDADLSGLLILSGPTSDRAGSFGLHSYKFFSEELINLFPPGFSQLIRPEGVILESPESLLFVQDFENGEGDEVIVRLPNPSSSPLPH